MKLLMLNSTPVTTFGGVEQWMVRAALGLVGRGHDVHAVGRHGSRFVQQLGEAGIPVEPHHFGMDYDPVSAVWIARLARRAGAELAVVNYNKELTQVALARRWSPIGKVVGRSVVPMLDTGSRHQRLYRRHLDGLITPSRAVKDTVESYPWMAGTQIEAIPNGLSANRLDEAVRRHGGREQVREDLSLGSEAFVVGSVGRLERHKGYQHLLVAFGELVSANEHAFLVIVGDGSFENELRDQATGMGEAASRILFTGYRPDPDRFLLAFDALVLPSTTRNETFGQVLVEAMAFQVPVVGSEVGGIPEIIDHEQNGLLVQPGDEAGLAAALDRLAGDSGLRTKLAEAGRRKVEAEFREETMLDRLESFLASVQNG
jgi:glycosyltransferase involved in cell wall biosynthesis